MANFVFKAPFRIYKTHVYDGERSIKIVFRDGKFETDDGYLAKLIVEQKIGKDRHISMDEKTEKMLKKTSKGKE